MYNWIYANSIRFLFFVADFICFNKFLSLTLKYIRDLLDFHSNLVFIIAPISLTSTTILSDFIEGYLFKISHSQYITCILICDGAPSQKYKYEQILHPFAFCVLYLNHLLFTVDWLCSVPTKLLTRSTQNNARRN